MSTDPQSNLRAATQLLANAGIGSFQNKRHQGRVKWAEKAFVATWVGRHGEPQAAYQRLLAPEDLSAKARNKLLERFESLDPFKLAQEAERRLKSILSGTLDRWVEPPQCFVGRLRNARSPSAVPPTGKAPLASQLEAPKKRGTADRKQLNLWCYFAVRQPISI